jgi:hypothetical protein
MEGHIIDSKKVVGWNIQDVDIAIAGIIGVDYVMPNDKVRIPCRVHGDSLM